MSRRIAPRFSLPPPSPPCLLDSFALYEASNLFPDRNPPPRLHTLQPPQPEGPASSPLPTISSDQFRYQHNNSQHVRHNPLNGFPATSSELSTGYSGAPSSSIESSRLSYQPSPHHGSINPSTHRPRTSYTQVFHTTSDLAAHHGIPQSLPPPPRTTPRRSSEPEPLSEFSLSSLCSNYLTMLSSNKSTEQTAALAEHDHSTALTMTSEDEAAAQVIASALSATFSPLRCRPGKMIF
ncbi:hypothetical protein BC834DRAFT_556796 [Gloeopeniophorella convolvens]|nr:hypothetical protein BC834DRAFT_556796 [Gloeopeniophorella convolvens]